MADGRVIEHEEREDEDGMPGNLFGRLLQIASLDRYLEVHGLEDVRYGAQSEHHLAEARHRLQQESDYQKDVHRSIFGAEEVPPQESERRQFLASIQNENIDIETSKEVMRNIPLRPLAESCDTLFTLATFRQSYQGEEGKRLSFSLKSFQHEAVVECIAIMLGDKKPEEVSADHVVECCEIARYMQCGHVLEAMVDILVRSVSNANCLSLCQLADQLDLPRLFERAVAQMMQLMISLQDHEVWDDFNPELKSRIIAMQNVMHSSIHANVNKIYFSSMDEYLSIFAENIQYYRERLEEAKERQAEEQPVGHAWQDAQAKIDKQEARLITLETVFEEQKDLFGHGRQHRHSLSHSDRKT